MAVGLYPFCKSVAFFLLSKCRYCYLTHLINSFDVFNSLNVVILHLAPHTEGMSRGRTGSSSLHDEQVDGP